MKLQKICLWKKVFSTHPDELPDAMFLQANSDCHHCEGNNLDCRDYVPIFQDTTSEVMELKYKAHYNKFDLVQQRNGTLERVR